MPHAVFASTASTHPTTATASRRHTRKAGSAHHRARHSVDLDMHLGAWQKAARERTQAILDHDHPSATNPGTAHPRISDASIQRRVTISYPDGDLQLTGWEHLDRSTMAFQPKATAQMGRVFAADPRGPVFAPLTEAALLSHTTSTHPTLNGVYPFSFPSPVVVVSDSSFSEIGSRELNAGSDIRADYEIVQHQPTPPPHSGSWPADYLNEYGGAVRVATHDGATGVTAEPVAPFTSDVHPVNHASMAAPANTTVELPSQEPAGSPVDLCPLEPWEDPNPKPPVCTAEYKKMAGHLSEWAADIVLRVVRGANLDAALNAPVLDKHGRVQEYGSAPSLLVDNIRYCLMSTLLQPSVVFMGIYFICKLPVFADCSMYDSPAVQRFRRVLFGEGHDQGVKSEYELYAPFRMFVNGILLASKTLDDATFSNRVWHDISRIPVQDVNALELASLELLAYDLTVPTHEWTAWLDLLKQTHVFRAPYPAPIGPAKETPHGAVSDIFTGLIAANTSRPHNAIDGPIFLGIEERITERLKILKTWFNATDDDLDAGGPLRDKYHASTHPAQASAFVQTYRQPPADLPPPAEWYPAADPIVARPQRSARYSWGENQLGIQQQSFYATTTVTYIAQDDYCYPSHPRGQFNVAFQHQAQPAHQPNYYRTCCA